MAAFYDAAAATHRRAPGCRARRGAAVRGRPVLLRLRDVRVRPPRPALPTRSCPASPACPAAWARAGTPMTHGDDVLTVLPGTLAEAELAARLRGTDAAVIMKVGRNLPKIRAALAEAGRADRASMSSAAPCRRTHRRSPSVADGPAPYFSLVLVPGRQRPAVSGSDRRRPRPGRPDLLAPRAPRRWRRRPTWSATAPISTACPPPGQTRHASDNRVELDRAHHALSLAAAGARVAVVSGGDPGVFGMAAAVFEAVEAQPACARAGRSRSCPASPPCSPPRRGSARRSATISAPSRCRTTSSPGRRCCTGCARRPAAGFVLALYNPLSRARPWQLGAAFDALRESCRRPPRSCLRHRDQPPGRARATPPLAAADPARADMRTLVLVGSAATRPSRARTAPPGSTRPRSAA